MHSLDCIDVFRAREILFDAKDVSKLEKGVI